MSGMCVQSPAHSARCIHRVYRRHQAKIEECCVGKSHLEVVLRG